MQVKEGDRALIQKLLDSVDPTTRDALSALLSAQIDFYKLLVRAGRGIDTGWSVQGLLDLADGCEDLVRKGLEASMLLDLTAGDVEDATACEDEYTFDDTNVN